MHLRRSFAAALAAATATLVVAGAAFAGPLASFADAPIAGPWVLAPGEYYVGATGSSFHTTTAFDDNSERSLITGEAEQRSVGTYIEMGWHKHTSLQFSVPFVTSSTWTPSGGPASMTALGDFGLGYRRALTTQGLVSALQLRWEAPLGYNDELSPAVGDGRQKLSAGLELGGKLGKGGFWSVGGGYRYDYRAVGARASVDDTTANAASQDWSDHATAHAALAFWVGRLQLAGLYGADLPMQTGRRYDIEQHVAGPRVTYRVDGGLDVYAGSWHTPSGRNAPHVDQYYAGIAWKLTKLDRSKGFIGGDARP